MGLGKTLVACTLVGDDDSTGVGSAQTLFQRQPNAVDFSLAGYIICGMGNADLRDFHAESQATWGLLATHLLETEKKLSWCSTHPSFSRWLVDFSKQTKHGEASLWRVLSAGRYYNELRTKFSETGMSIPALDSSRLAASPESLELVDKLSRVAPPELLLSIQHKVLSGSISRRELRAYWETYRPVLEGQTARGRNVAAPRFNPRNIAMLGRRLEADCIAGLVKDREWLGGPSPFFYKVINTTNRVRHGHRVSTLPDVIVICRRTAHDAIEIHGVEATIRIRSNEIIDRYRRLGLGVDYLWAAVPTEPKFTEYKRLPSEIGLLEAGANGVRVIRSADNAMQSTATSMVETLREILAREVSA